MLAADKVPTAKLEKHLDELAHKWDDIKRQHLQVKGSVEPIQVRRGGGSLQSYQAVCACACSMRGTLQLLSAPADALCRRRRRRRCRWSR